LDRLIENAKELTKYKVKFEYVLEYIRQLFCFKKAFNLQMTVNVSRDLTQFWFSLDWSECFKMYLYGVLLFISGKRQKLLWVLNDH